MSTLSEALAIAIQHHQGGRLQAAQQIYQQILLTEPHHADVIHLLGMIAHQRGQYETAVEYMARAIALNGKAAPFHSNLGEAYRALHRTADAIACYRRALELTPDCAAVHNNLGNAFIDQGSLDEAASSYRRALELEPDYAEAHYNLANILTQQGRLVEAVASYRRALQLKPDYAEACSNLGVALKNQGQGEDAIASYRRALQLKPDVAEAHNNLGNALRDQGNLEEAVACYRRALQLRPDYVEAHNNLGNALRDQGKLDEALASFRQTLALRPDYAEAHNNLGNVLKDQRKTDEALAAYHRALELKPDYAEPHYNLGTTLQEQGQLEDAVAAYRQALKLQPNYAQAHSNLGVALKDQGKLDEAVACYRRAIQLSPDVAEAHNNLGAALLGQGKPDAAIASYRRALELNPDYAEAHNNLGVACKDQGRLDEALACYRRALELKPDYADAHSNLVYTRLFCPAADARALYAEHRRWDQQHAAPLAAFIRPHLNDRSPQRRLRVGYIAPDFRDHCQSFFTVPLFSAHDHEHFEVVCYADVVSPDNVTAHLRSYADTWRNIVGLSHEQVARLIQRDSIDILVDLTMHMARNRLLVLARKPAPVQVCWLAYPGTTGLSAIDYRLTDPHLDPPGLYEHYYSEESVRLPDSFWCYDPLESETAVSTLPAAEKGYITWGCLNNFCKVNAPILKLWAQVLQAVDRSRLTILASDGTHRQHALDLLAAAGVEVQRVTFVANQPRQQYLKYYHGIDIGLDTVPYNGHTTSLDSFWMGVPVVTLVGPTVVGRAGLCQAMNLGLPELIASNSEQYVRSATRLAQDLPRLSQLRATLRQRMQGSPLMDAPRFARNVEAAYRQMWQRWCAGKAK